MALYTIGEVALLCDINPVTLRAWQRRYGLLKPQRTDGGHRLFNDADIDRIREIKRWIDNGVQVSKVKMLLSNENVDVQNGWRDQQETLLTTCKAAICIACERGSKSAVRITPPRHSPHICLFLCADGFSANNRLSRRCWRSSTAY